MAFLGKNGGRKPEVSRRAGRGGKRRISRRLARLSARGRKRENAALFAVLFLLFLLVGAAVAWLGIAKKTEEQQRFDAYGEWKAAFYAMDRESAETFVNNPLTTRSGISKVLGDVTADGAGEKIQELEGIMGAYPEEYGKHTFRENLGSIMGIFDDYEYRSYFGIADSIGTVDAGFVELGRIAMEQGRFPEEKNEIAMTRAMLLKLGYGEELGQEIELEVLSADGQVAEGSWRLSGVLSSYGATWKKKGYPVVSAVISEESLAEFPWEPTYNVLTDVDGAVGDTRFIYKMSEVPMDVVSRFTFNDAAYDFWGRSDDGYILTMLLAAALAAAVTVFQLTAVQIRKRSRQVGLLKAIGATNAQVRGIFLREVTGVLWRAAAPGTLLGTVLVPAVLWGSGLAEKRRLYWGLNLPLLLGTVAVCCTTTWIGALLPVWKGGRIPIRGELLPKAIQIRPMKRKKNYGAGRIVAGRGMGAFRLAAILLLAVTASSVFLVFYQREKEMTPYRGEKALHYQLVYSSVTDRYGGNSPNRLILEQLEQIPGVEAVYTRKNGVDQIGDFYISYEGVEECELERLRKNWDVSPYSYVYNKPYKEKDGLALVHLMGIYSDWEPNMDGLSELVTEGEFDREAFESGEEVLLFLPPYREMDNRAVTGDVNRLAFHTDRKYRDFYETETCVKPGDTITLVVKEEIPESGKEWERDPKMEYNGTRERQVKVGGIIRYLPKNPENVLWDECYNGIGYQWGNDMLNPYTVVADGSLVTELRLLRTEMIEEYERQKAEKSDDPWAMEIGLEIVERSSDAAYVPFEQIEILCDSSASESTQSGIESLAEVYGLILQVPENAGGKTAYELWKTDYREASNRNLLYLMAAVAAVFIFVCLLLQNVNERLAEDRRRMGIFQALGVRTRDVTRGYARNGFENGLMALLLAHGVLVFSAVWQMRETVAELSPYRFVNGREAFLYRFDLWFGFYDWGWHLLICMVVLVFSTMLYVIPLKGVLKHNPVENIRELGE